MDDHKKGKVKPRTLADLKLENSEPSHLPLLSGQTVTASPPWSAPPEVDSVAPKTSLDDPRFPRKGDPKISPPHLK